jgi:hypothetical protein
MKQLLLLLISSFVIFFIIFIGFGPTAEVTAPEVQKTSEYKRPVREGNCWRQFVGTGTSDSILVCH